jgi:hypothetical protein
MRKIKSAKAPFAIVAPVRVKCPHRVQSRPDL